MTVLVGKRRKRPQWFEGATMMTCLLLWISPSSCAALFHNNGTSTASSAVSLAERVWGKSEESLIRKEGSWTHHDPLKPVTVVLGDSYQQRGRFRRRRVQVDFTVATDSPTFAPVESPVSRPSMTPTLRPSRAPSTLSPTFGPSNHNRQAGQPTEDAEGLARPLIPFISKSTRDTPAPFQPLKFAAVPVGFDVLLETEIQQDLDEMAQQAKIILEDHLARGFAGGFDDQEGVVIRSVDLNVKAFLTNAPSQRDRLLHQIKRFLQLSRAITLEARGVAGFQVNRAVDSGEFLRQVNAITDDSVKPERLMAVFQNSTSGLSDYRISSVNSLGNEKDKPTNVEIGIAIVLLVLAAAGLVAYAYIFYKKRKKRLKRRKQFGVGHKPPSPYPRPRPHGASVTPTGTPGSLAGMPASLSRPTLPTGVMNSSSSESSYKGLGSDSDEEDADVFAKELRLAASLDRKAWNDFQKRTQPLGDNARAAPSSPVYNSEHDVYMDLAAMTEASQGIEMEAANADSVYGLPGEMPSPPGAIGLTVTGDTVSIQSNNSFPYGDERENADHQASRPLAYGTLSGSPHGPSRPEPGTVAGDVLDDLERDDSSGGWRMTKSATSELNNTNSPPRYSFLYHGNASKLEPETHSSESTSALEEGRGTIARHSAENSSGRTSGAVRGSPMSHSWSTNPPRGSGSVENATTAAVRGSPQSSWNSTSRALSQDGSLAASPALESTGAVNEEIASAGVSEEESMVTADIVKEVQRLSQFVKTYEKKKEIRMKRDHGGLDDVNLSNSLTSSLDYDSLMDTVTSLQNVVASDGATLAKKNSPADLAARVNTSSTRSSTPNHSASNSPDRAVSRGRERDDEFDGIQSIQSDDSSDVETMESDDLSRRLGITPFQVQNPNTLQRSPVSSASYHPGSLYQRNMSPENERGQPTEHTNRFSHKEAEASSGALSSLRHSDAILDGSIGDEVGPSDEFSLPKGPDPESAFPANPLRNPQTITPRKRSKNQGFNSIVSKFEAISSEREPIYPPSESWQYNY